MSWSSSRFRRVVVPQIDWSTTTPAVPGQLDIVLRSQKGLQEYLSTRSSAQSSAILTCWLLELLERQDDTSEKVKLVYQYIRKHGLLEHLPSTFLPDAAQSEEDEEYEDEEQQDCGSPSISRTEIRFLQAIGKERFLSALTAAASRSTPDHEKVKSAWGRDFHVRLGALWRWKDGFPSDHTTAVAIREMAVTTGSIEVALPYLHQAISNNPSRKQVDIENGSLKRKYKVATRHASGVEWREAWKLYKVSRWNPNHIANRPAASQHPSTPTSETRGPISERGSSGYEGGTPAGSDDEEGSGNESDIADQPLERKRRRLGIYRAEQNSTSARSASDVTSPGVGRNMALQSPQSLASKRTQEWASNGVVRSPRSPPGGFSPLHNEEELMLPNTLGFTPGTPLGATQLPIRDLEAVENEPRQPAPRSGGEDRDLPISDPREQATTPHLSLQYNGGRPTIIHVQHIALPSPQYISLWVDQFIHRLSSSAESFATPFFVRGSAKKLYSAHPFDNQVEHRLAAQAVMDIHKEALGPWPILATSFDSSLEIYIAGHFVGVLDPKDHLVASAGKMIRLRSTMDTTVSIANYINVYSAVCAIRRIKASSVRRYDGLQDERRWEHVAQDWLSQASERSMTQDLLYNVGTDILPYLSTARKDEIQQKLSELQDALDAD